VDLNIKHYQWLVDIVIALLVSLVSSNTAVLPNEQPKQSETLSTPKKVVITSIIDGDTIRASDGAKIRLIGIDAPELSSKECYATESTQLLKEYILQKEVELVPDRSEVDRYGRLLRYVYYNQELINALMVEKGAAIVKIYPPDIRFQQQLFQAQNEARQHVRGLWNQCKKR
jgi:endonuclease YncB( thermonuclease family)